MEEGGTYLMELILVIYTRDPHNFKKVVCADELPTWTERDTENMKSKKVVGP